MSQKIPFPRCTGNFDVEDPICNGDPEGATEAERTTCGWRDRCGALQAFCAESGKDPSIYFLPAAPDAPTMLAKDQSGLLRLLDTQVKRFGVVEGVPGGTLDPVAQADADLVQEEEEEALEATPVAVPRESVDGAVEVDLPGEIPEEPRTPRPIPARARKAVMPGGKVDQKRVYVRGLFDQLTQLIKMRMGKSVTFATQDEAAATGQLYVKDRTHGSLYCRLYQKTATGKDRGVLSARFKMQTQTLDICLPVSAEDFTRVTAKEVLKRVNVVNIKDGVFYSLVCGVDRDTLPAVADALQRLDAKGIFPLRVQR